MASSPKWAKSSWQRLALDLRRITTMQQHLEKRLACAA
jgi:hypothetical protein